MSYTRYSSYWAPSMSRVDPITTPGCTVPSSWGSATGWEWVRGSVDSCTASRISGVTSARVLRPTAVSCGAGEPSWPGVRSSASRVVPVLVAVLRIDRRATLVVASMSSSPTCSDAWSKKRWPASVALAEVPSSCERRRSNRFVPTLNDM
jgi:hypothetical protein